MAIQFWRHSAEGIHEVLDFRLLCVWTMSIMSSLKRSKTLQEFDCSLLPEYAISPALLFPHLRTTWCMKYRCWIILSIIVIIRHRWHVVSNVCGTKWSQMVRFTFRTFYPRVQDRRKMIWGKIILHPRSLIKPFKIVRSWNRLNGQREKSQCPPHQKNWQNWDWKQQIKPGLQRVKVWVREVTV